MAENCPTPSRSKFERFIGGVAVSGAEREEEDATRIFVRVTSFRRRLIDWGNLTGKFAIDALRYAGFLRDDTEQEIIEEITQVKVHLKEDERTEIDLVYPEGFLVNQKNRHESLRLLGISRR